MTKFSNPLTSMRRLRTAQYRKIFPGATRFRKDSTNTVLLVEYPTTGIVDANLKEIPGKIVEVMDIREGLKNPWLVEEVRTMRGAKKFATKWLETN